MPMLGSNLTLRFGSIPTYVYLDWLECRSGGVITDFIYSDVRWPVSLKFIQTQRPDSWTPCIVAAGGRRLSSPGVEDERADCLFHVTYGENEGDAYPFGLFHNVLYQADRYSTGGLFYLVGPTGSEPCHFKIWKETSDPSVRDAFLSGVDTRGTTFVRRALRDPGWRQPAAMPPNNLTFFCFECDWMPEDSPDHFSCFTRDCRFIAAEVQTSADDETPRARFVPVLDAKKIPGLLDEVSGKFYPAFGGGVYSLGGEETQFDNPL